MVLASSSYAFQIETREQIVEDAVKFCPPDLRTFLMPNISILKGKMSFASHMQRPIDSLLLKEISTSLIEEIKSGTDYNYNTISKFGLVALFITEAINPYFSANSISLSNNRARQVSYKGIIVIYDGYQPVPDPEFKFKSLTDKYQDSLGYIKPSLLDSAYNDAVNEVSDFFISIWQMAGKPVNDLVSTGFTIDHRSGRLLQANISNQKRTEPTDVQVDKDVSNPKGTYWQVYQNAVDASSNHDWNGWEAQMRMINRETDFALPEDFWQNYHRAIKSINKGDWLSFKEYMEKMDQEIGLDSSSAFYNAYDKSLKALSNRDWREYESQFSQMEGLLGN